MDYFLSKITAGAVNYAIRSGLSIGGGYAIQQCSRYIKTIESEERDELATLQRKLDSKIQVIAPAIDMIELIAARGNTSLESAVTLTKIIRWHIQELGRKLAQTAADEESSSTGKHKSKSREQSGLERKLIVKDLKTLIERIDDAVPLINLAITTSGVSLSTNLPASVSPSRLLQASTFLSAGDSSYLMNPTRVVQIGPRFTVSMYMLFMGHANKVVDEEGLRTTIWKEVMHKAQVKLVRVALDDIQDLPFPDDADTRTSREFIDENAHEYFIRNIPAESRSSEFAYQLSIIEDLEDDRVHTFDDGAQPGALDDVNLAGMRSFVPIHEVAKIFYADTGKILNMGSNGESSNPVLLLKRDLNATAPRRAMQEDDVHGDKCSGTDGSGNHDKPHDANRKIKDDQAVGPRTRWKLPSDLDPEWIAFEVYTQEDDSDSEEGSVAEGATKPESSRPPSSHGRDSVDTSFATALSRLHITPSIIGTPAPGQRHGSAINYASRQPMPLAATSSVTTSLSLMEMLIRLTSLQQFQQCSHLAINDELLNFFLEESSTTGAANGDGETRKRIRMEARQHVGFDPYDESPIKRRGEAYQRREYEVDEQDAEWSDTEIPMSSPPVWAKYTPSTSDRYPSTTPRRQLTPSRSSPSRSTPPLPGQKPGRKYASPITPPGTTGSRQDFIRAELRNGGGTPAGRSSPLAKEYARSPAPSENGKAEVDA